MVEDFIKRHLSSVAGVSGGIVVPFVQGEGKGSPACFCDGSDSCRLAIVRTYRELRAHGVGDVMAFETSLRLFRLRHPETPTAIARTRVADWICHALGQ